MSPTLQRKRNPGGFTGRVPLIQASHQSWFPDLHDATTAGPEMLSRESSCFRSTRTKTPSVGCPGDVSAVTDTTRAPASNRRRHLISASWAVESDWTPVAGRTDGVDGRRREGSAVRLAPPRPPPATIAKRSNGLSVVHARRTLVPAHRVRTSASGRRHDELEHFSWSREVFWCFCLFVLTR